MEFETKVQLESKTFRNEKGEDIAYDAIQILYKGNWIRVSVKKEDKSLFNFLKCNK